MSARDELARTIRWNLMTTVSDFQAQEVAKAILAAGYVKPRTITTRDEVETLPDGSIILDSSEDVAHLRGGVWCSYETAPMTHHRMAKYLPATVLYEPTA